jgi:hypothetical protein
MRTKSLILICVFLISVLTINAQTKHETFLTVIEKLPTNISIHIPKGYQVLDTTFGNLNFDNYQDLIVVLKSPKEDTSNNLDNPIKRPLLILFGDNNHNYKLGFKNDNVVYCNICGGMLGDPFNDITIKNGYFTVEHYGGSAWRWTNFITFKFDKVSKRFYLHRENNESFNANNPNKAKTTVKTKKDFGLIDFEKYDNSKE